ncbi:insulinase family protein [Laceyella putida]|uniref:Insulinase family protein n=1 Tax=Laceyella putida TaxID=110101 RepID=A0ABW2RM60_9BACL
MTAINWKIGERLHGFILRDEQAVDAIDATARVFEHVGTGAKLLQLANGDPNNVFAVGFKTPPRDHTGLTHILEHSVLCGSRKYPVKQPFKEMLKGSLSTFLNALTFSDKTVYPVASRNWQDFRNLVSVYVDAVFFPKIHTTPEIFLQEGWHYSLPTATDPLTISGVVYNEMKGVYSSPDSLLGRMAKYSLYPDTPYGFDSGGNPDHIPDLTLEQFLAYHRTHYHPSNSYFYLYGNGNVVEMLKLIHEEALVSFAKREVRHPSLVQSPFPAPVEKTVAYPAPSTEGRTLYSASYAIGQATDPVQAMMLTLMAYVLFYSPASPLKRTLLDAGIGKVVSGLIDPSMRQPMFCVLVKHAESGMLGRFQQVLTETLRRLVTKGIDPELLQAGINWLEVSLREPDQGGPAGLTYYFKVMNSWLHGGDPLAHLRYDDTLAKLRAGLKRGGGEQWIQTWLLDNRHAAFVVLEPSVTLAEEREKAWKEKLERMKRALSEPDKKRLIDQTQRLQARQRMADRAEDLARLPVLSLKELPAHPEPIRLEKTREQGIPVLFTPQATKGIHYLQLLFDTQAVPQERIPYIPLLAYVLGKMSTRRYPYGRLSNAMHILTGGMQFKVQTYPKPQPKAGFTSLFQVGVKLLPQQWSAFPELLNEILAQTRFEEKERLLQLIRELKAQRESSFTRNGHQIALMRVASTLSDKGQYDEMLYGIQLYRFLNQLERDFADRSDEIVWRLQQTARLIFQRDQLTVHLMAAGEEKGTLQRFLEKWVPTLAADPVVPQAYQFVSDKRTEAFYGPSGVQYVAQGGGLAGAGGRYEGNWVVLKTLLETEYLWNRIRVQGGAYGAMCSLSRMGTLAFVSYRDPHLKETLAVYEQIPSYLRRLDMSRDEWKRLLIGTIRKLDPARSPSQKGEVAILRHFSGITDEMLREEWEQVLRATIANVRRLAPVVEGVLKEGRICVIGNEAKIKASAGLFDQVGPLT